MFTKGLQNTVKTILIFLLVIAMAMPQTVTAVEATTATTAATKAKTGWVLEGKHTFFLNSKGAIVTGWQKINDYYYYFRPTGAKGVKGRMLTGWRKIDGKTYYLEKAGAFGVKGHMKTGWQTIGNNVFYFGTNGAITVGWNKIGKKWFYFETEGGSGTLGCMAVGWKILSKKSYYFKNTGKHGSLGQMTTDIAAIGKHTYYFGGANDGALKTGWQTINKKKYYFRTSGKAGTKGRAYTGWQKIGGKVYCFAEGTGNKRGQMLRGWQQVGNHKYYFNSSGQPNTGWQKSKNKWYYFKTSGGMGNKGRLQVGWHTIDQKEYYFHATGKLGEAGAMATGLVTIGTNKYYFGGANDGTLKTGWQTIKNLKYCFSSSGALDGSKGAALQGWHTIGGSEYYFHKDTGKMATSETIDGVWIGSDGKASKDSQPVIVGGSGKKTIKSFLQSAMKPVGSTLYIWGGGHDAWEKGGDGVRAGVNPNWKKFYNKQKSSYDYNNYRFKHGNGLDCSGFVGWTAYNAIESKSNIFTTGSATTSTSTGMPAKYAGNGWGKTNSTSAGVFTPGDVVSRSGHVWIVVGQCKDKSVVLVHSTPQAGVQIAGTPTPDGSSNSQAIKLAQSYMKKFYPDIVSKFKLSSTVGKNYLAPINRFQWDVSGKKLMKDPEGYLKKTPQQILKDIFGS